jgi:hypothetical protein
MERPWVLRFFFRNEFLDEKQRDCDGSKINTTILCPVIKELRGFSPQANYTDQAT